MKSSHALNSSSSSNKLSKSSLVSLVSSVVVPWIPWPRGALLGRGGATSSVGPSRWQGSAGMISLAKVAAGGFGRSTFNFSFHDSNNFIAPVASILALHLR